jgi:hypothetical protein
MLMKIKVISEILPIGVARSLMGSGTASSQNPSQWSVRFLASESESKRPHSVGETLT